MKMYTWDFYSITNQGYPDKIEGREGGREERMLSEIPTCIRADFIFVILSL